MSDKREPGEEVVLTTNVARIARVQAQIESFARFTVSGELHRNVLIDQDLVYGPVTAKCTTCQRDSLLFGQTRASVSAS